MQLTTRSGLRLVLGLALGASLVACGDDGGGSGTGGGNARPTNCATDADCNDDDPCTTETCVAQKCEFTEAPDGDAPEADQIPGDCAKIVCEGGVTVPERDVGDIDDDHEPCTLDLCENGEPSHEAQIDGVQCVVGAGEGTCSSGLCIVPCSVGDQDYVCDDFRPCTEDACVAGTCQHRPIEGRAPDTVQNEGDCVTIQCIDGDDVAEPDDTDVPLTSNPCIEYVCSSGELAEEYIPDGELATIDPNPGDCQGYVCDGNGGPSSAPNDEDVPDDENECTIDLCDQGYPAYIPEPPETACASGVCDGQGSCCEPRTCDDVSVECGRVDDSCNGFITCGGCDAPEYCGAGGSTNSCGCQEVGVFGPFYPRIGFDDDDVGEVPWATPQQIFQYDGYPAYVEELASGQQTHWLRAGDFRVDVPSHATITGIEVTWLRSGGTSDLEDKGVRIAKGGAFVGEDKALGTTWGGDSYGIYGGPDDLWGTSWTPEDLAEEGFGVGLSVGYDESGTTYVSIDSVWVVVYFEVDCGF